MRSPLDVVDLELSRALRRVTRRRIWYHVRILRFLAEDEGVRSYGALLITGALRPTRGRCALRVAWGAATVPRRP